MVATRSQNPYCVDVKMNQPKFTVDSTAFVVGKAEFTLNNQLFRIPLGTQVKVRTVSVMKGRGYPAETRYEVLFQGGPLVCWLDEGVLSSKVMDV